MSRRYLNFRSSLLLRESAVDEKIVVKIDRWLGFGPCLSCVVRFAMIVRVQILYSGSRIAVDSS